MKSARLATVLVAVATLTAGCGEAPSGDSGLDGEAGIDQVVAHETLPRLSAETTPTSATISTTHAPTTTSSADLAPAEVGPPVTVTSWEEALSAAQRADNYALAQADFAGSWIDTELRVLYYAFTDNIVRHEAQMRAIGVDLDSGFYELRRTHETWDNLTAAYEAAIDDWATLAGEWHVVEIKVYPQHSWIVAIVDEDYELPASSGPGDVAEWVSFEAHLSDSYGTARWVAGPGTATTLSEWEETSPTAARAPTIDPSVSPLAVPPTTEAPRAPVEVMTSWDHVLTSTETGKTYAEAQPDYAGTWVDDDLDVFYYAFTDNVPQHKAQMRALGVDFESGFYEIRKAYATYADLVGFFDAMGDSRDSLEADWGVVDGYLDISENVVFVIIDETAGFPVEHLDELRSFLETEYGHDRWVTFFGLAPVWEEIGETL